MIIGPWLMEQMVVTVVANPDGSPCVTPYPDNPDFVVIRAYVDVPSFMDSDTHALIERRQYWVAKPMTPPTLGDWQGGLGQWFTEWAKEWVAGVLEGRNRSPDPAPDWVEYPQFRNA